MEYELQIEHDAGAESGKEEVKQKRTERKILVWRIAALIMILAVLAMIIYFLIRFFVWAYDGIFNRQSTSVSQQIQGSTAGSAFQSAGNVSSQVPPPPPVSNFNVIQIPSSQAPGQQSFPPAAGQTPQSFGQNPSGQINNPGGCPDYLGDNFACVPNPPSG